MAAIKGSSRLQVIQLLNLLDRAFAGNGSLLSSLRTAMPADWEWLPPDERYQRY